LPLILLVLPASIDVMSRANKKKPKGSMLHSHAFLPLQNPLIVDTPATRIIRRGNIAILQSLHRQCALDCGHFLVGGGFVLLNSDDQLKHSGFEFDYINLASMCFTAKHLNYVELH